MSLRDVDADLLGRDVPDWYVYLRAHRAGFDAIVTREWHHSGQAEELWVLTTTRLSVVTWRQPLADPVAEWAQLMAYLPVIRRLIASHGPAIVLLPRPSLGTDRLEDPGSGLAAIATQQSRSRDQLVGEAQQSVRRWLDAHGRADELARAWDDAPDEDA